MGQIFALFLDVLAGSGFILEDDLVPSWLVFSTMMTVSAPSGMRAPV
jgi:hypothetical protein